jgi:1-deoxy-D-xylulose-5-phosphate reductoisomerase
VIRVAVLGSTGSIGRSALTVLARHPDRFQIVGLAANRRVAELAAQVENVRPAMAVVADESAFDGERFGTSGTEWRSGWDEVVGLASRDDVDVVVNALVGAAGLEPTLEALRAGKRLALANKESLVAGGPLVLDAAARGGGEIVPVDSEHSAILQCMEGSEEGSVARVVLTASGGPFRGWNPNRLREVAPEDALRHPTWEMGAKITVDSATLANKALEVIEAHFLYGMAYDAIDVVVHPQSIVHSFVEFVDGSVLAQVGTPTMELPILYALTYPDRIEDGALRTFDPVAASPLTFESIDHDCFPLFGLGLAAGRRGGSAPAAFNAANEIAVEAFLDRRIRFDEMAHVVAESVEKTGSCEVLEFADVLTADREARSAAREAVVALGRNRSLEK